MAINRTSNRASNRFARPGARPSVSFVLLCLLLVTILIAGGASMANVSGQLIVRAASWAAIIVAALGGVRPDVRAAPAVFAVLAAMLALVLLQLVPLPPAWWQALPGRAMFADASALTGAPQPWRPLAIVPGAAWNAAFSLVVPFAVFMLVAGLRAAERTWLPALVLGLICAATLSGLLQFSGARFDNPFINDGVGEVAGTFANRNHFALFLAAGCVTAPAWAFLDGRRPRWRLPVTLGLVLLFALTILASGSRAGILLGIAALVMGMLLARRGIMRAVRNAPRWVLPAIMIGIFALIAGFVFLSIDAGRAVSIDRALALSADEDLRARALPTVLAMIPAYFPAGIGFGAFDPLFRVHEPLALLSPEYFNHAHNDFLEVALDGGLAGVLLLAAAIGWWMIAGAKAWMRGPGTARLGSAIILLVLIASAVDYPARTPTIMALTVIAAMWLNEPRRSPG